MKRGGMFYEISFFMLLVYAFISKWIEEPRVRQIALAVLGVCVLYELLYILFLGRKDFVSFGRSLAIAGFYLSLVVLIMYLVYLGFQYFLVGTVAGLFSINGFFDFYSIPMVINAPYVGAVPIVFCILYILIYTIVTRRQYLRSSF